MELMLIQDAAPRIAQGTVLAILIASTLIVVGLLGLIGIFAWKTEQALEYGNFFVVVLGILTALVGFLVAFPLLVSGIFDDPTQVIAILSGLFGTITGLVGTFFGVKSSADARQGIQDLASSTVAGDTLRPVVSLTSPQDRAADVPPGIRPTATFARDMDRATINTSTFKLLDQHYLQPVDGRVDYDVSTRRATFIPSAPLQNGRTYSATITAGVKDKAGNTMAQDRTWHFTVRDQDE
jgi:hypothetical protein